MAVLVICPDLIFSTKIFSTAKSLGVATQAARTLEALREKFAAGAFPLMIVDLNAGTLDPLEAIRLAKASATPPRVVAFLSHVQADLAAAARAAGADQVLARSAFTTQLPAILQSAAEPQA